MSERYYPKAENLGKPCLYWGGLNGCQFPKFEMEGRRSCEGIIDDVCLWLKERRIPQSLSNEQLLEMKTSPPSITKHHLPPGHIEKR